MPIAAGALAVTLLGAGAAFVVLKPTRTPTMVIDEAQKLTGAAERTRMLHELASDERTTEKDFERACALLDDVKAWDAVDDVATAFGRKFPNELSAALFEAKATTELRKSKRAQLAIDRALALAPKNDARPELQ